MQAEMLRRLRDLAAQAAPRFQSAGFRAFFAGLRQNLDDGYLALIKTQLDELRFPHGMLLGAKLGPGNQSAGHILCEPPPAPPGWWRRLLARQPPSFVFRLDPHDEPGARILGALKDQSLDETAGALAQASDHVADFFAALRTELAFCLGAINLHRALTARGAATAWPEPAPARSGRWTAVALADPSLVLRSTEPAVGSDLAADGKNTILITGPNQGGKTTFLRALGLAQLMMQAGLFVTARAFSAETRPGLFTHCKREEDRELKHGKFVEELERMSAIVGAMVPGSLLLCNESFASTYEREGSRIARDLLRALRESGVKTVFVTHLYELSGQLWAEADPGLLCLRAGREADGRRTHRLDPGQPLSTSYGTDLYRRIFSPAAAGSLAVEKP